MKQKYLIVKEFDSNMTTSKITLHDSKRDAVSTALTLNLHLLHDELEYCSHAAKSTILRYRGSIEARY